jgi:hypothetical protein
MPPRWRNNDHSTYNINNNFTFAIFFIIILLASSTLTGSSSGKVSSIQPFEQQQQQALKIWSDSLPTDSQKRAVPATSFSEMSTHANDIGISPAKSTSSDNCLCPKESNSTRTTNVTKTNWTKANATSIIIVKNISNIRGPVKVNFVNSYWTFNTAQDQFVAGTTSARTSGQSILPVIKQEVGPGEGPSILAVVLINEGFSAITGITSSLQLPPGFEPLITPQRSSIPGSNSQTALSSYDGVVEPGGAFTLYFGVKVLGNAQVDKQYNPQLKLGYVKVTELRQKHFRSETITVPFTISGRVILDAVSSSSSLTTLSNVSSSLINSSSLIQTINVVPGVPNAVKLTIRNDGSASARGVIVNIAGLTAASVGSTTVTVATNVSSGVAAQPSSSSTVILGSKVFSIGTILPGGSQQITLIIYPSIAAAGTVQTLNLALSFDDAYGNRKTTNQLVGLQILPISPQSGLSVSPSPSSSPSSPSTTSPSSSRSSSFSVSPATSSGNEMLTKVASFVQSNSNANNGNTNNNPNTSVDPPYTNPSSPSSPSSSSHNSTPSLIQIAAGKIQNLTFAINNDNAAVSPIVNPLQNSITDLAVSLVSQSSSVRILGPSNWNLPTISPGSGHQLSTPVFASTSLMGNPVVFTVAVQYIQNGHQVKTALFNLGAMVVGDIELKVTNLSIRYIGNTPNLVGNILNEGNTPAQFASVEMLNQGQGQSPTETPLSLSSTSNNNFGTILMPSSSKYLGEIATNFAIPFNVPLQAVHVPISKGQEQNKLTTNKNVNEKIPSLTRIALNSTDMQSYDTGTGNNTTPEIYPVSFKITYSDNLKNIHEIVVISPLQIKPQQPERSSNQVVELLGFVIGVASIGVAAAIYIRKWLRSSRNENLVSKAYKKILNRTTRTRVEDREAVIPSARPPDEKKVGAPFYRCK